MKIEIHQLSSTVDSVLNKYTDDVIDAQKKAIDEEAKEALDVLKSNAPVRKGNYKKSLKKKKTFENLTEKRITLHADKPRSKLPHLLERPHATRNGGRTKAIPHFSIADEHVKNNLEKKIKSKIENLK